MRLVQMNQQDLAEPFVNPLPTIAAMLVLAFASAASDAAASTELSDTALAINKTIRDNHYRPSVLDSDEYLEIENKALSLGRTAASTEEFLVGFQNIWRDAPFSHVGLRRAEEPASSTLQRIDTALAAGDAVTLTWKDDTAILTVNTMSGTIEKIEAAYDEIAKRSAKKLIIDLRMNSGGAFAVVPLVGHLIDKPTDIGVFVTRRWYDDHAAPPSPTDMVGAVPWRGYSVKNFVSDVMSRSLTSYRIDPMYPHYGGPVCVLTSGRTISAGEIAVDALKATRRATVVGERTPGILLSSNLYDIHEGLQLRVPIADYYSIRNGRIEGVGVSPDIEISADQALDAALKVAGSLVTDTSQRSLLANSRTAPSLSTTP